MFKPKKNLTDTKNVKKSVKPKQKEKTIIVEEDRSFGLSETYKGLITHSYPNLPEDLVKIISNCTIINLTISRRTLILTKEGYIITIVEDKFKITKDNIVILQS